MYIRHGFRGLGQTSGLSTIAATIQTIEGYYPGTIAYTNNNPGNLIYVGQAGASPGTPMAGTSYFYASFPSYDAGYQALLNQIQTYADQGLTIDQMMNKYAPASGAGNNPTSYANSIASSLGVSTDTTVADAISGSSSAADSLSSSISADLSSLSADGSGDTSSTGIDPVLLTGGVILGALLLSQLV